MTRRIILHFGAPKAGSTFLQRVLLQNTDRLAAAGVAYPHDGSGHPGNAEAIAARRSLDRDQADDIAQEIAI